MQTNEPDQIPSGYNRLLRKFNICIVFSLVIYLVCIYSQRKFGTGDTYYALMTWWDHMFYNGFRGILTMNIPVEEGGAGANYTSIWYAVIWLFIKLRLYPHFPIEYCIKSIAVVCSVLSALTVKRIVQHYRPDAKYMPNLALVVTLYMPAFLLDVVKTNLPDSTYLMFALMALLAFIKDKKSLAWVLLGFGICFKLMAIYLAPFFIYFYLKDFDKYKISESMSPFFIIIPILVCSVPHVIAGGTWFGGVIEPLFNRAGGYMQCFSYSLWQFMPNYAENFTIFSVGLTLLVFAFIFFFVQRFVPENQKNEVEYYILLPLFPMICYYLLPAQHEGYFAMAAVFSFIVWCIKPVKRYFIIFFGSNLLLFIAYCAVSIRWYYEGFLTAGTSIIYDVPFLSLCFASIMFYAGYHIYKNSDFYGRPAQKPE